MRSTGLKLFFYWIAFQWVSGTVWAQETRRVEERLSESIRVVKQVLVSDTQVVHGKYRYYYQGRKMVEGQYHVGKRHGEWLRYHQNGQLQIRAFYLADQPHGTWQFFYSNGQEKAKLYFEKGIRTGVWQSFYPSGNTAALLQYKSDTLFDTRYYYDLRTIDDQVIPAYINQLVYEQSDTLGYSERYYDNGKLYQQEKRVNGQLDSIAQTFFSNGFVWNTLEYDQGKLKGILDYKVHIGRDADPGTFRDGNGELLRYDFDGALKARVTYANGWPMGRAKYWNNGVLWAEGYFNAGQRIGNWTYYDAKYYKKKAEVEYNFIHDNEVHMVLYGGTNAGRWEGGFVNGKKQGMWRYYNQYNELTIEHQFHKGYRHGWTKAYRSGGTLAQQGGYFYGLKTGTWKYYNGLKKVVLTEQYSQNVSANETYLTTRKYVDNNFEDAYYDEKQPITVQRPVGMRATIDWVTLEAAPDNRDVFPIPTIRTEYRFKVVERPAAIGFYGEGVQASFILEEFLNGQEQRPTLKYPGIYSLLVHTDYFGWCQIELVRQLGFELDNTLLKAASKFLFWNPKTTQHLPVPAAQMINVPLYGTNRR